MILRCSARIAKARTGTERGERMENRMAVTERRLSELMDWSSALKVKGEIKQRQANKFKLRHIQIESLILAIKGEKSKFPKNQ